jgi:hypothetical protein
LKIPIDYASKIGLAKFIGKFCSSGKYYNIEHQGLHI